MKYQILSDFDSCRLFIHEMSRTKGGSTKTSGAVTVCNTNDSDHSSRDYDDASGSELEYEFKD